MPGACSTVTDREARRDAICVLNGTALDEADMCATALDWAERNLGLHCKTVEQMAVKQEQIVAVDVFRTSADKAGEANSVDIELLTRAAAIPPKMAPSQRQLGQYFNPRHVDTRARVKLTRRADLLQSMKWQETYASRLKKEEKRAQRNQRPRKKRTVCLE